jgi:choline dehydrogenase-like flavoprotein
MAPGTGVLPAAAGPAGPGGSAHGARAIDVAPTLERYLAALPPHSFTALRVALRGFDWLSFPWRFSRADVAARQDFLRELESSPSRLKQDALLFLKVLTGLAYANDARVREAVGYEATCRVTDERGPTPGVSAPDPLGDLFPDGSAEDCDVLVVGSGAGGAVAAAVLAEAGHEVLVLEAGPYMNRESYPEEPLAALTAMYRDGGLTVAQGKPAIPTPVGRAVGGTTVINSGTCFRAPDRVLAGWASEHGIEWAQHLDPDYAQAEEMLNVKSVDPALMGRNGQLLREGAEALGVSHGPLHRNAGDCVQCSSCPTGCRLDAKRAMHVSYLPRAVAAGARVRAGVEAQRLIFHRERAVGVDALAGVAGGRNGPRPRPFRARARRAVVLAGGAFGTPELLLRSGFRASGSQVGRNLRIHPACWVGARFDEEVRGWDGVMQSYAVDEWSEQGLLLEATFTPLAFGGQWLPGTGREHQERLLNYGHIASTGVHLSDRSSGRVEIARGGSLRITYGLTSDDARRLTFGIARAVELFYAAGAREVYPQVAGIPRISVEQLADLEASPPPASSLRLEAFHPMGTARMDADPARGLVGIDGAVYGAERLYVADGSLLPSSIGVNPMMTIIAIASRISRDLANRLD